MQIKKPLTISYCQAADKELKELTAEAVKLIRATSPPPETLIKSFAISLAALALYPDMMRQSGAITDSFERCYARRPDATLQILAQLRELANERQRKVSVRRQKDANTQSGRVLEFMKSTLFVVKKNGQLIRVEKLTAEDFLQDGKTLKRGIRFIPVTGLHNKDIAQFLTKKNFNVTADSVKKVLQSLHT